MKIVVQTTQCAEASPERYIVDQETYLYFRDEVFFNTMNKWFIFPNHKEFYMEIANCNDPVQRINLWHEYKQLLSKYYRKYLKKRKNYYYRNGNIYHFRMRYGEIEILMLENEDISELLNYYHDQQKSRFVFFAFFEEIYTLFKTTPNRETYNKWYDILNSGS